MFKRFVSKALIFFQIYGVVFQGVVHADIIQDYTVRNEIYVHGSVLADGGFQISLGTDSDDEDESEQKLFKPIDVPAYKRFKDLNPVSDFTQGSSLEPVSFPRKGITQTPEGIMFKLLGLQIFMSNDGLILVQGVQTDFSKAIFLSSEKGIILHNAHANILKLSAPKLIGAGHSSVDFLSLEGLSSQTQPAQFLNGGTLTAKEIFVKNLESKNTGVLKSENLETQSGTFNNMGTVEIDQNLTLGVQKMTNSGQLNVHAISCLDSLREFENTLKGNIKVDDSFKTGKTTIFVNDGTAESDCFDFQGAGIKQNGMLTAKTLKIGKKTKITTGPTQKLKVSEALQIESRHSWKLEGTVNAPDFSYLGNLDLRGAVHTKSFKGHGVIRESGKLFSTHAEFTKNLRNFGEVSTHILHAKGKVMSGGFLSAEQEATFARCLSVLVGGEVVLTNLNLNGLTIENAGNLLIDPKKDERQAIKGVHLNLVNAGVAVIKGNQPRLDNVVHFVTKENATYAPDSIRLNLTNTATGNLSLSSARYDFIGDQPFVNEGVLNHDQVALQWLIDGSQPINKGTWNIFSGNLDLLDYNAENEGIINACETVTVTTAMEGMKALASFRQSKPKKIVMRAPAVNHASTDEIILPWVAELRLEGDFSSVGSVSIGELDLYCNDFKPNGRLFTERLTLECDKTAIGVDGLVWSRQGIYFTGNGLAIESKIASGKSAPECTFARSTSGFHSEGPIVLAVNGPINLHYGTIIGQYYTIAAESLNNIAGYIYGADQI